MRIMQTHRPMLLHNVSQRSQDIHRVLRRRNPENSGRLRLRLGLAVLEPTPRPFSCCHAHDCPSSGLPSCLATSCPHIPTPSSCSNISTSACGSRVAVAMCI